MSDTFCSYPWKHLYIGTTGHTKVCCLSDEHVVKNDGYFQYNLSNDGVLDGWNNEYMQNVRKKMLSGERLKICKRCYDNEDQGLTSMRAKEDYDYYKKNTENGITPLLPSNFELHFGNVCNLSCKMCSQQFSHKVGQELLKIGKEDADFLKWVKKESGIVNNWTGELNVVYDWFRNQKTKIKIFNFVNEHVNDLMVIGGEPTAITEFYELLEFCYEKNTLKDKKITMVTNCTNTNSKLIKWLEKTKEFNISISIDGLDQRQEYIRYPSTWTQISKSLDFYIELAKRKKNTSITLFPTIQILNIDQLCDLIIFFEDKLYNEKINFSICWTLKLISPVIFDYEFAPKDYREYVAKKLSQEIKKIKNKESKKQIQAHINLLLNTKKITDPNILRSFIRYNDKQDSFRKTTSWRKILPNLEKSITNFLN
jgi:hypothetical protein